MTLPCTFPRPLTTLLAATAWAALVHSPAHAQGHPGPSGDGLQWGVGAAVMSEARPYAGVESKTRILPAITFDNRWVRLFGPTLELKLGQAGPARYSLVATYADEGYKPGDAIALNGMAERKSSAWLGARAVLPTGWANLMATWTADASGNSKGQKFSLRAERRFALGDLGATPRLVAHWTDSKAMQYYHGVNPNEATPNRPAYQPGANVDTELGVRLDYRLAPRQILFGDFGVRMYGSQVKNSPLVDRSSLPEVRLGYQYRF